MEERELFIPRGTAKAFVVKMGQTLHVRQPQGGKQVGDLNAFNLQNPRERFWGSRTAAMNGAAHLSVGGQLISTAPPERPMFTIVADSLSREPSPSGARFHDVLMGRCSRRVLVHIYGPEFDRPGCQELLAEAIAAFGLTPYDVHDAFNLFMRTGYKSDEDRMFLEESDAREGDYIDLKAEMDCIVAISSCQGGSSGPQSKGLHIEIRG